MTSEILISKPEDIPPSQEIVRTTVGVWLVPVTPEGEIFVVRNLEPKFVSQKVPGQLNCPAETYKLDADSGKFLLGTLPRAIREEIGYIAYDPSKVKPLGYVRIEGVGQPVIAAPYLIPVASKDCVIFKPQEEQESDMPQWTNLDRVIKNVQTLNIGRFKVPLFRTPMSEIATMVRLYQKNPTFRSMRAQATIPLEVYDYLKANLGAYSLP